MTNCLSGVEPATQVQPFRLPGGESVTVRAIGPQDADRLQTYMRNLSGPTRRNRFLGAVSELAPRELERLTHLSGASGLALIALARASGETAMVAETVQVVAQTLRCEIALSVADAWQRKGLGTLLLSQMERWARLVGARSLVGEVLRTNDAMKGLARKSGFAIRGPFKDARLVEIVKDLSIPQTGLRCREQPSRAQSIAA